MYMYLLNGYFIFIFLFLCFGEMKLPSQEPVSWVGLYSWNSNLGESLVTLCKMSVLMGTHREESVGHTISIIFSWTGRAEDNSEDKCDQGCPELGPFAGGDADDQWPIA